MIAPLAKFIDWSVIQINFAITATRPSFGCIDGEIDSDSVFICVHLWLRKKRKIALFCFRETKFFPEFA
jgi:hypothetical protein